MLLCDMSCSAAAVRLAFAHSAIVAQCFSAAQFCTPPVSLNQPLCNGHANRANHALSTSQRHRQLRQLHKRRLLQLFLMLMLQLLPLLAHPPTRPSILPRLVVVWRIP